MTTTTIDVDDIDNIKGLFYIKNTYIHSDTIKQLDSLKWTPLTNSLTSRKVQHYGYKYNYTTYKINDKCEPLPDFLEVYKEFLTDICQQLGLIDDKYEFNQCIVNNYQPSQGISPHIDVKSYGPVIGCFTIGSGANMTFIDNDGKEIELYVEPDSLYIMSDESRYKWKHCMKSKKYDLVKGVKILRDRRISITFRNVPE